MDQTVTGRQIAAGRTLLGMGQAELAALADVSAATIKRMEASAGAAAGIPNNVKSVRAALEFAGVIFVEENGEGPGVRLRKGRRLDDHPEPKGPATEVVKQMDAAIEEHRSLRKTAPRLKTPKG